MKFNSSCNWKAGFVPQPGVTQPVGYVTDFEGLGLKTPLAKDLSVYTPYNKTPTYSPLTILAGRTSVVALLENVAWGGGVGDAITFSCYMSSENANLLKVLKQMTLKTMSIGTLGFWVGQYDGEAGVWFEAFYPKTPAKPAGLLNAVSKVIRLNIDDAPVKVAPNIDVNVYNVYFEVVPAANKTATFNLAPSSTKKVVLPWGSQATSASALTPA
jgi:hypothetical protein